MNAKRVAVAFVGLLVAVGLIPAGGAMTWTGDLRLTQDENLSVDPSIALNGDKIHVVWADNRDDSTTFEIYYKRSLDEGQRWTDDVRLTQAPEDSAYPDIDVSGSKVFVVWEDSRDYPTFKLAEQKTEIYFKRSANDGYDWTSDQRISSLDGYSSSQPQISADGSNLYVVWMDKRNGDWEVYFRKSTNAEASWGFETPLSALDSAPSASPSVANVNGAVHVAWQDRKDGNWEIYYRKSLNGGDTWLDEVRITDNSGDSFRPRIAASSLGIYLTWNQAFQTKSKSGENTWKRSYSYGSNTEVYFRRSTDGGQSWGPELRLTYNLSESRAPEISSTGRKIFVVWADYEPGNLEIFFKQSFDNGATWGYNTRLTNYPGDSVQCQIAATEGEAYIVWSDSHDGNPETYYKKSVLEWENPVNISENSYWDREIRVSAKYDYVHAIWERHKVSTDQFWIYYRRSTDGGSSWDPEKELVDVSYEPWYSDIATSGQLVHVTWDSDTYKDIWYMRGTSNGDTWEPEIRISSTPATKSNWPQISANENYVHIVWKEDFGGSGEIYYARSDTYGVYWYPPERLTSNYIDDILPRIASGNGYVHVVWFDGSNDVKYRRSTDNGATWEQPQTLAHGISPSVSTSGNFVHVVFDGDDWLLYMRSEDNGENWGPPVPIAPLSILSYINYHNSIWSDESDVHVVFVDEVQGDRRIYYKRSRYNGNSWEDNVHISSTSTSYVFVPDVTATMYDVHVVWEAHDDWEVYYRHGDV